MLSLLQVLVSFAMISVQYAGVANGHARLKADVGDEDVISYWSKRLPSTAIPPSLVGRISPLSHVQADSYRDLITAGQLLSDPVAASAFCSSAGLLCSTKDLLAQDSLLRAMMLSTSSHSANFRYELESFALDRSKANFRYEDNLVANGTSLSAHKADRHKTDELKESGSWFLEKDLGTDAAFLVPASEFYNELEQATHRSFLPRELADVLGLELPNTAHQLHIPEGSIMGEAMRQTAEFCASSRSSEVSSACVVSLDGLADYAAGMLNRSQGRSGSSIEALSSFGISTPTYELLQGSWFKVVKVEQKTDERSMYLSCHSLIFPFLVTFCHQVPATKIFSVTLQSTAAEFQWYTLSNIVVCHMDTAKWDPDHVAFKVLGNAPGQSEACHWSKQDAFSFVLHN